MKRIVHSTLIFILGAVGGSLIVPAISAQVRNTNTTRLMAMDLAGWCDGKEVIVELNASSPGTSGKHYHPGHTFSYVIEGAQTVSVEGGSSKTFRAGEVFHEAPMEVSTSAGPSSIKMFTVRLLEKGKPETVRVP